MCCNAHRLADGTAQLIEARALERTDKDPWHVLPPMPPRDVVRQQAGMGGRIQLIDLVAHQDLGDVTRADAVKHPIDLSPLLVEQGAGGIDHVQQQIPIVVS